jgi:hypothetical protein
MTNSIKISQLPAATTPLTGAEEVALVQGGVTKQATVTQIGTVTATGSTTARTLANRFADIRNLKDFGAVGDGVTNDTAAVQAAINAGGTIIAPNGVYLIDEIVPINPFTLVCDPLATFKQRSGGAVNRFMFRLENAGCAGSSITGGVYDGDRNTHSGTWGSLADWCAFRVAVHNVQIRNVRCQNFGTYAANIAFSDESVFENWDIVNCGKMLLVQFCDSTVVQDIRGKDIGNNGLAVYQHLIELRGSTNCLHANISVDGWNPDDAGLEPYPIGITLNRLERTTVQGLRVSGFSGTDQLGGNQSGGILNSYAKECTFDDFFVQGSTIGIEHATLFGCNVSNMRADGEFIVPDNGFSVGVIIYWGGQIQNNFEFSSFDTLVKTTTRRASISGINVSRHNIGAQLTLENCDATGIVTCGNVQYGLQVKAVEDSLWFPQQAPQTCQSSTISNIVSRLNGYAGIVGSGMSSVTFGGAIDVSDNGQLSDLGAPYRSGVLLLGELSGGVSAVSVSDITAGDTQNFTEVAGASFLPGSTVNNRKEIVLLDPDGVGVGQYIVLKNATGSDLTVKVVDTANERFIVETSSPQTFTETGNLIALTGTVSISAQTVTGSGTLFESQITGHTWLKIGSQYGIVSRVLSNTSLILQAPLTNGSGLSISRIAVDLAGVPSQQYGININSSVFGPVAVGRVFGDPLLRRMLWASVANAADGQIVSFANFNLTLDTSSALSGAVFAIPAGYVPVDGRLQVIEAVTGANGTLSLELWRNDTSVLVTTSTSGIGLTKNSQGRAAFNVLNPLPAECNLIVAMRGGADNIPSGGKVRVEATLRKVEIPVFPNVP